MKIHGHDLHRIQDSTVDRTAANGVRSDRQGGAAGTASGDAVSLSSDAQLLQTATAAAQSAPDIRADVVAHMRALVDAGQIGRDPQALADAIIDHSLTPVK